MNGIFIMDHCNYEKVYSKEDIKLLQEYITIEDKNYNCEDLSSINIMLKSVDVIFSSWGCPKLNKELLNKMPNLKAIFYGAGSVKNIVTDEFWNKDITLCSAWCANAIPVAEYTFAQIILSLKQMWRNNIKFVNEKEIKRVTCQGTYKSKVGIISLGMIGKLVCDRLKTLDIELLVYDPFKSEADIKEFNGKKVELSDIFSECDVISLHTPWLKETENMINKEHFSIMKENATFINTARGAVVNETDLIKLLTKRSDIFAILDVTYPEPPEKDSMLFNLDNVYLTPHIAGSMDNECLRMGNYMVKEFLKWNSKEQLDYKISKEIAKIMA